MLNSPNDPIKRGDFEELDKKPAKEVTDLFDRAVSEEDE